MSGATDILIKNLADTISDSKDTSPKPYDTQAEVRRVEGSTAWVHIPGGVDETPIQLTTNAKKGDIVQVRISGGRAWITGNATSPPTDDTKAEQVDEKAETIKVIAIDAKELADSAEKEAVRASAAADSAEASAEAAAADALTANTAANNALAGLSVVESVVDTVNWFAEHKVLSTDTTVNPTKTYYIYNQATNILKPAEPEGTENPSQEGWYELNEAISNYIATHIALTSEGLWVTNDDNSYSILLSNEGMKVYDESFNLVSTFGESITFSSERAQYIGDSDAYISFDPDDDSITIGGTNVTTISPISVFTWDMNFTEEEREEENEDLELSEDTSTWIYNDFTSEEMTDLSEELNIPESTSSLDYGISVDEYKILCNKMEIPYQFGRSVYIGMDAISLGDSFFVDDEGYLVSTRGNIGGWNIGNNKLSYGESDSANYIELSGSNGISLGKYFNIKSNGVITARRGNFAGFTMVPVSEGNDYLVSDYKIDNVTWRTWIRSAQTEDVGKTWAFSTQYKKDNGNLYYEAFTAKSNGELTSIPVDNNGDLTGVYFNTKQDKIEIGVLNGGVITVDNVGVYVYPNHTTTSQPNLWWNTSTGYLYYTTWSASSEQIKNNIKTINNKKALPENLYDVEVIQFQYKDDFIDKDDPRNGEELVGFIIEDLDKKYPIAVDKADKDDPKTWAWNGAYIIPPMLKLIQDQHKQIDDLQKEINDMKKQINEIEALIKGDIK